MRRIPPLPATLALLGVLGCSGRPAPVDYARTYPSSMQQSRSVDIHVFKLTSDLRLTNTTAHAFGPGTLWLNARFSRPIAGLGVGETLTLPLVTFRDEFQDPFRPGGFFATEKPEKLVLAQIETSGSAGAPELIGLIVVSPGEE